MHAARESSGEKWPATFDRRGSGWGDGMSALPVSLPVSSSKVRHFRRKRQRRRPVLPMKAVRLLEFSSPSPGMGFRGSRVQIPPSRLIYNDLRMCCLDRGPFRGPFLGPVLANSPR
jgi:hypothetical protein